MLYLMTQIGFVALTVIFFYLLYREFKIALPATSLSDARQKKFLNMFVGVLVVWAIIVSAVSIAGVMGNFSIFPFNFGPFLLLPLVAILLFTFSRTLKEILPHIHPSRLIRLQVFRVFVEILLWFLFIDNVLPIQMTFEGQNFDVLSGVTAPIVAYLAFKNKLSKSVIIIWNLACLGLLINIVSIAILSMPTPFRFFMNEPANTIVAEFPISWLPTFLVPLAYMLSFISIRQLTLKK
ncbi:MAG TPA: hypothetical protein VFU05_19380 [Cyclobacteriaceae bacterium]|nr:hypothetical protein [Cyclobacteriaceae bacterium]